MDKKDRVAIVGAGVSGLTCAVLFAEKGYATSILAEQIGDRTDSAAAAAIWYPYDVEPAEAVMPWALFAYEQFLELARDLASGVSVVELRTFSRLGPMAPPEWARPFAPRLLHGHEIPAAFVSGFSMRVPLIETTKYLEYLKTRAGNAGASLIAGVHLPHIEDVEDRFDLVVNCSGIGAKELVPDPAMEPHRGQVAIVAKLDLSHAVVCDDPPLMYAIPRSQDCVLGGTNDVSDNRAADSAATARIVAECQRVLGFARPIVLAERVGLRPCRKGGVRVGAEIMRDGRRVIHNYGHGGAGFTLSWGCAETVLNLARK